MKFKVKKEIQHSNETFSQSSSYLNHPSNKSHVTRNIPQVTYVFCHFNCLVWGLWCSHVERCNISHIQVFFSPNPKQTPTLPFCFCVYCWTKRFSMQYMWCNIHYTVISKTFGRKFLWKMVRKSCEEEMGGKIGWKGWVKRCCWQ